MFFLLNLRQKIVNIYLLDHLIKIIIISIYILYHLIVPKSIFFPIFQLPNGQLLIMNFSKVQN
jgi:hypothetical protein